MDCKFYKIENWKWQEIRLYFVLFSQILHSVQFNLGILYSMVTYAGTTVGI